MKLVIANAAFVVNLLGLVIAGYLADAISPYLTCYMALWFIVGAYASGLWAFGGRK